MFGLIVDGGNNVYAHLAIQIQKNIALLLTNILWRDYWVLFEQLKNFIV